MRPYVHILLHALVPLVVAGAFYRPQWLRAWSIMMVTMLVDLDHVFASPLADPNRCSIGFHPLHQTPAIVVYIVLLAVPKLRLVGLGLVIHMLLDGADCVLM